MIAIALHAKRSKCRGQIALVEKWIKFRSEKLSN